MGRPLPFRWPVWPVWLRARSSTPLGRPAVGRCGGCGGTGGTAAAVPWRAAGGGAKAAAWAATAAAQHPAELRCVRSPCAPAHATGRDVSVRQLQLRRVSRRLSDCDADRPTAARPTRPPMPPIAEAATTPCADQGFQNVEDYTGATSTCDTPYARPSFGDCDNNRGNGCERATNTLHGLWGCNVPCSPQNAVSPTCATGTCDYAGLRVGLPELRQ